MMKRILSISVLLLCFGFGYTQTVYPIVADTVKIKTPPVHAASDVYVKILGNISLKRGNVDTIYFADGTFQTTSLTATRLSNWNTAYSWGDWHSSVAPKWDSIVAKEYIIGTYVPLIRTINGYPLSSNVTLNKSDVGLSNVPNVDATNPANISQTSTYRFATDAEKATWNAKEPAVTIGNTTDYYRGDKTFQPLNKAAVGLSNVDNTSDVNKPISIATQSALNLKFNLTDTASAFLAYKLKDIEHDAAIATKQPTLVSGTNIKTINSITLLGAGDIPVSSFIGYTPENVANKAIDFTVLNNTRYPSVSAVKTLVDASVANGNTAYSWGNHAGLYYGVGSTVANSTLWNGYGINLVTYGSNAGDFLNYDNTLGIIKPFSTAQIQTKLGLSTMAYESATNYYTKTNIQDYFSAAAAMTGYNKSNWDAAYSWGNHSGLYYTLGSTVANSTLWNGLTYYGGGLASGVSYAMVYDATNSRQGVANASQMASFISGQNFNTLGTAQYASYWGGFAANFNVAATTMDYILVRESGAGIMKVGSPALVASFLSGQTMDIGGKADGANKLWSVSHPTSYYLTNTWDGSYWRLSSNHPSGVSVEHSSNSSYASSAPWTGVSGKPANIMYYQGFTLDANTMDFNASGFSYSVNAPHTGSIIKTGASGYELQLSSQYTSSQISFRTRNGDAGAWNSWREFIHSGNISSQSVSYATTAGTSSYVTINYNDNSNSSYQMLWGSGNSVYGTAGVTVNPYTDYISSGGYYVGEMVLSSNQLYRNSANEMYLNYSGTGNTILGNPTGGVTVNGNTNVGGTLRFASFLYGNNGWQIFDVSDTYLRLNQAGHYSSGVYTPYNLRVDGSTYFGGGSYYINGYTANLPAVNVTSLDASNIIVGRNSEYLRSHVNATSSAQYQTWYNLAGTRRGYFGFGGTSSDVITLANETGGYIAYEGSKHSFNNTVTAPYFSYSGTTVSTDNTFGIYFDGPSLSPSYAIYRQSGAWAGPYPDLHIAFHTGIKIGAHYAYGGTRFYDNSDMATELFSIGNSDRNIKMSYQGSKLQLYNPGSNIEIDALQASYFGYSSGYAVLQIGDTRANRTLAFGVDLSANTSGSFNGGGSEYMWKNAGYFKTPNGSNAGYNTLFQWSSVGDMYLYNRLFMGFADGASNTSSAYYLYSANSGVWTNNNLGASGDIYLGARSVWLSAWINQAVKTTDAPTFANVTAANFYGNSTTSTSTTLLGALGNYVWNNSSVPTTYQYGAQVSFVSASQGFPNYGSVLTVKTYSGGGGTLQLFTPYGDGYGGTSLMFRNGNYPADAFTAWKTIIDNTNIGSQTVLNSAQLGGYTDDKYLRKGGSDYYQQNNWIQVNGGYGLYWPNSNYTTNYGGTYLQIQPNYGNTSYGSLLIYGRQNSYAGITFGDGGNSTLMYDAGGNGGGYTAGSGWHYYWQNSTGLLALGGSTVTGGYKVTTNGSHYVGGELLATGKITSGGNVYTAANYGYGLVGLYDSYKFQAVYAMGDAYKVAYDGSTPGNLYGISWVHSNAGGQAALISGHHMLVMANGLTQTAIGSGIWTNGAVTATAFYQSSDIRLKNVISQAGDMITYTWKDHRDKLVHYGYSAQEKEINYPFQVSTATDGIKSVNYIEIHTKKINDLEIEVSELKILINQLLNKQQKQL